MAVTIAIESPNQPEVTKMLDSLDRHLDDLYPPESNHIIDLPALLSSTTIFCVARSGEEAVGCGAAMIKSDEKQDYGEIKRMYVETSFRGAGIGSMILTFLHKEIVSCGVRVARLETGFSQSDAIRLYENFGYHRTRPFGDYRLDPLSLFFEKQI